MTDEQNILRIIEAEANYQLFNIDRTKLRDAFIDSFMILGKEILKAQYIILNFDEYIDFVKFNSDGLDLDHSFTSPVSHIVQKGLFFGVKIFTVPLGAMTTGVGIVAGLHGEEIHKVQMMFSLGKVAQVTRVTQVTQKQSDHTPVFGLTGRMIDLD